VEGQSNRHLPSSEPTKREKIRRHLVQADDRVASGEKTIARQWAIVTELVRDGQDTSEARSCFLPLSKRSDCKLPTAIGSVRNSPAPGD
jgi:hypothetical protein